MRSIIVRGGMPLAGEVRVEGAKNSALKLMAATLLASGPSRILNVPDISDVDTMGEVLVGLGAAVTRSDHELTIDTTHVTSYEAPYEMVARMRASIAVLGPLIARFGQAKVAMPGGCAIGSRKIDMHIRGLEGLGVEVELGHGYIHATAPHGLHGAHVTLDFPSVGATENLLMASVLATGSTTIENAAREPEIVDLADFLIAMGARIEGAGSGVMTVEGVESLHPVNGHAVVGDRIEAGTFLIAGAIAGGPVTVRGFDPHHLDMTLSKLKQAGCTLELHTDGVTVSGPERPVAVDIQTLPHPGFPTDMQAQFMALMAVAEGSCVITENVFENRFMFADELSRMAADVRIEGHHALVKGVARLSGAPVRSPDLRGGAALVIAGLVADGVTEVTDVYHIERGYERFVEKMASLGADIELTGDPSPGPDDDC
ncbi:MAG: UDP-N-acetylglucosamine 1-carboxyvinyltransferase [Coriobacteriia bacterium]|nr:UDP-N-acetylglucosamine 1-carboxyvinyltransferase [Coriobacteriia bacterium]